MLDKKTSKMNLRTAKTFGLGLNPDDREKLIEALINEREIYKPTFEDYLQSVNN